MEPTDATRPASLPSSDMAADVASASATLQQTENAAAERTQSVFVARETNSATVHHTHIADTFGTLLWVFTFMSVAGLVGETIQHYLAFGEWESRMGFIWGPFSPIYGTAAVLITMILEPLQDRPVAFLLLVGGVVGGSLEYFASWAMETFWGVVAWSYLNIPFNFDGRTDVFHCVIWGTLGVLWVKAGLPLFQRVFDRINLKGAPYRIITGALAVFMVLNIAVTITVLLRADARTHDIPPQNALEQLYDVVYPNEVLSQRFQNMGGIGVQ